jgi:hypothetical protein
MRNERALLADLDAGRTAPAVAARSFFAYFAAWRFR